MFCEKCGEQLDESASRARCCSKCGAEVKDIGQGPVRGTGPVVPARKKFAPLDRWRRLSTRTKSISLGTGAVILAVIIIIVCVLSFGGGGVIGTYVGYEVGHVHTIALKSYGLYERFFDKEPVAAGEYKVVGNQVFFDDGITRYKIENYALVSEKNKLVDEHIRFEKQ